MFNFHLYSYFATGDSYITLSACFQICLSTIHTIVNETCLAICHALSDEIMPIPDQNKWQQMEEGFRIYWRFPNCL